MMTNASLSKTQKYCLTFTLALALTLAWTTLARADGPSDLDITFGGTGIVTTSISTDIDAGLSAAIQSDGKIVVAGVNDGSGGDANFAVIRYNNDGSLDTTFNSTGIVTTPSGVPSWGFSTAIQPDGKIVVAGVSWLDFGVARYTSDGDLDTNFNGTGIVMTSISSFSDVGRSMALQPDGKIVVAGYSETGLGTGADIAVVRYTITGSLDTAFNNTGIVTTHITSGFDEGHSVAIQPDDKIVVAGVSGSNIAVVRYTITGTLDTSFNSTGIVTTPVGAGASANGVALQPDGKIVVAGRSDGDFALVRYHNNGMLDTEFNGTGIITTAVTSDTDFGFALARQPNGKIVVTGFSGQLTTDKDGDMAVVRYNNDGSLDTTFSNTGIVTTPLASGMDSGRSIIIQPDGKIVVAGFSNFGGGKTSFAVVRYLGDPMPVLTKTVDDDIPEPGQPITYTLTISNSGSFSTTNLLISDTLPLSLTLAASVTLDPPQSGAILATSPLSLPTIASSVTISPMIGITVTIPVTVSADITPGLRLTNTATITSPEMSISVIDTVVIAVAGNRVYLPVIMKNQ